MAQYQSILAAEYNTIQAAVAKVLGKTASNVVFGGTDDDYGYGQEVSSSALSDGTTVTAAQWQALTNDVIRCLYYQTGSNPSSLFASTENVLVDGSLTAVTSGYPYSATITTTSTATSAINNYVTVASTVGMNIGMTIIFTGTPPSPDTTFGNIQIGTTYYIFNIINSTQIQLSTVSPTSSTTAFVLTSKTAPSGSITVTAFGSKGQFILEKDRLQLLNYSSTIATNRFNVYESTGDGISTFTQRSFEFYPLDQYKFGPWQGTVAHLFKVSFGTGTAAEKHKAARYFFNSGGSLLINAEYTGGTVGTASTIDDTWSIICSRVQNFIFKARSCSYSGGSFTTVAIFNNGNSGFYNLTTGSSQILRSDAPTATAYDPNIYYAIGATYDQGGNLDFTLTFYDAYAPGGFGISEAQTGQIKTKLGVYYANGVDASGNNTIVITKPSATATAFA